MAQEKLKDILEERGNNYGNFHTQANLSQTLSKVVNQHYAAVNAKEGQQQVAQLPNFMGEAIHMICHKLARIANGNPNHKDSWVDIAGYAQLVVDILDKQETFMEEQIAAAEKAKAEAEKAKRDADEVPVGDFEPVEEGS